MADIGKIGEAFIEIEARSNVRKGVNQAVRDAQREASASKVSVGETEEDRRAAARIGAIREAMRADDNARARRLIAERMSGVAERPKMTTALVKYVEPTPEQKLITTNVVKVDPNAERSLRQAEQLKRAEDRVSESTGKAKRNFDDLADTIARVVGDTTGGIISGIGIGMIGGAWLLRSNPVLNRMAAMTEAGNPVFGFWNTQTNRDLTAVLGQVVEPISDAWMNVRRKMADTLVNFGIAQPRKEWTGVAETGITVGGGLTAGALALGALRLGSWIFGFTPLGRLAQLGIMAGSAVGGYLFGKTIDYGSSLNPNSSLGRGGFERLGEWFGGPEDVAMAFQSAASRDPLNSVAAKIDETNKILAEIRDKELRDKQVFELDGVRIPAAAFIGPQ